MTKSLLLISSHVAEGRVGNRLAAFAVERLGLRAIIVPTVIFSHTPGPGGFAGEAVAPETLKAILDKLIDSGATAGLAGILVGYLRTREQALIVADFLAALPLPRAMLFVDPILGDEDTGTYVPAGVVEIMRERIVPLADIASPNLYELALLSGTAIEDKAGALKAARALGPASVAVTSVPGDTIATIATLAVSKAAAFSIDTPRLAHAVHGTGDLLAALTLTACVSGEPFERALARAVSSVYALLREAQAEDRPDLPITERQDLLLAPANLYPAVPFAGP